MGAAALEPHNGLLTGGGAVLHAKGRPLAPAHLEPVPCGTPFSTILCRFTQAPGNPDPQGTGSPRPSATVLPPENCDHDNPSYNACADMAILGQLVPGVAVGRDLYPTGHVFRPSCAGLHRPRGNPGPQGTGSLIPC